MIEYTKRFCPQILAGNVEITSEIIIYVTLNKNISIFLMSTFNKSEQLAVEAFYDRRFPSVVMLILFSIVGIPGNIIVLLVYFRKRLTSTQFLISVIAMVDLFTAGVAIPLMVVYQYKWFSILDITFCKISKLAAAIGTFPGLYLIWGVSVVRYYHVCRPYELKFIEKKVKAFCVFVFVMSIFFSSCIFVLTGKETPSEKDLPAYYCYIADKYMNTGLHLALLALFGFSLVFCLTSIVIMYFLILRRVLTQKHIMNSHKNSTFNKSEKPLSHEVSKTNIVFTDQPCVSSRCISPSGSSVDVFSFSRTSINHTVTPASQESLKRPARRSRRVSYKQTYTFKEESEIMNIMEMGNSPRRNGNRKKTPLEIIFHKNMFINTSKSIDFQRTTLKVSIIGTVYVVTYVPWLICTLYLMYVKGKSRGPLHDLFKYGLNPGLYLCYLGCAVNPIVYAFVDPIFISKFKSIFRKK